MVDRAARLKEEFLLLREAFSEIQQDGDWFLIPSDARALACGWSPDPFPVAFHAQANHPGQAPYGIYVRSGARVHGSAPQNFQPSASTRPPFADDWGVLSWTVEGPWLPKVNVREGANFLNFALSFEERFRSGA